MTKKELTILITDAVRKVVKKELTPMIRKAIKEEFYTILNEAEESKQLKEEKNYSLSNIVQDDMNDNISVDETRKQVEERIFKGEGKIVDVLNQTAHEVRSGKTKPIRQETTNDQQSFILNSSSDKIEKPTFDANTLGYGDGFNKVGSDAKIPSTVESKKSSVNKIIENVSQKEQTVQLPTKDPDGKPINFNNVPVEIVQNMMKDYRGVLQKVEQKSINIRNKNVK